MNNFRIGTMFSFGTEKKTDQDLFIIVDKEEGLFEVFWKCYCVGTSRIIPATDAYLKISLIKIHHQ